MTNLIATPTPCMDSVAEAVSTENIVIDLELDAIYDHKVEELAESKSTALISNGMAIHAISLILRLITHASATVRILTKNLGLYGQRCMVEAIVSAIEKKNVKISILVQEPDQLPSNHPVRLLSQRYSDNIDLRKTSTSSDSALEQHMVVMDKIGYRFCPDRHIPKAVASFNRPDVASNLAEQFDVMFVRAESV